MVMVMALAMVMVMVIVVLMAMVMVMVMVMGLVMGGDGEFSLYATMTLSCVKAKGTFLGSGRVQTAAVQPECAASRN